MRAAHIVLFTSLIAIALTLFACGGNPNMPIRNLQAITVSPATATGSAQFSATGMFSAPPSPMMLAAPDVAWCSQPTPGMCAFFLTPLPGQNFATDIATIDANGSAKCLPGASGTAKIVAFDNRPLPVDLPPGFGTAANPLSGSAQLTCP